MPLKANATLTFHHYEVLDLQIELTFLSPDPGPGEPSFWTVTLTDTELAGVATQLQLKNLVESKLNRKFRLVNIASKLDQFIGQNLTV